jgi:hypothetical protein
MNSDGLLRRRCALKYAAIPVRTTTWRTTTMCRVLQLSRAGFYVWRAQPSGLRRHDRLGARPARRDECPRAPQCSPRAGQAQPTLGGGNYVRADALGCSMNRKGHRWATQGSRATSLPDDDPVETRKTARRAIGEFVDVWYNREWRHSSLGFCSPVQCETSWSGQAIMADHRAG